MQCDVDMPYSSKNLVRTPEARRFGSRHQNEFVPKGTEVMPQFRESVLHIECGNRFDGPGYVIRKASAACIEIDSSPKEAFRLASDALSPCAR